MKLLLYSLCAFCISISALSQTKMFIQKSVGTDSISLSDIKSIYFKTYIAPLAWWTLDEATGKIAYDVSGNKYNGTLSTGVTWVTGGLNLNGGNNAVDFADSVFRLSEGSWQVVINKTAAQSGWIICKDNFGFWDDGILQVTTDGTINFWIDSQSQPASGNSAIISSAKIPFNIDVTITAEWGSRGMKLFINDTPVGTQSYTGPILSPGRPLSLGQEIGDPSSFNGLIKDVKVYKSYIK